MIRFGVLIVLAVAACGQSLELSGVAVDSGSANILRIVLHPRDEKPLAALQWELALPAELHLAAADVVLGSVAESAEKSLTCVARKTIDGQTTCACILAGGVKPVGEGTIAIAKFTVSKDAHKGQTKVHLQRIWGVSLDSIKLQIPDVSAVVAIR